MAQAGPEGKPPGAAPAVYRSNRSFLLAIGAAFVALLATVGAPLAAYQGAWGVEIDAAHSHLLTALSAPCPLLALAGVLVWWGPPLARQALVWVGGLGTCAVCVAWVLLSGTRQVAFAPIPDGAAPGVMAVSATLGAIAALTMMVADDVAWRRALAGSE
jgi:hypothetical protein